MNTDLLRQKIDRFSTSIKDGKLNLSFAKELVIDLNTWLDGIEKYIGEVEFENIRDADTILSQQVFIEQLQKVLIITGHIDVLTVGSVMDKEVFESAVEFLLNNKDRVNASNIYVIGKLLELAKAEGKVVKDMVQLVNYARTGI